MVNLNYTGIMKWPDGSVWYHKDGMPHRLDGPAKIEIDNVCSYWIDGIKYSKQDYYLLINKQKFKTDVKGLIK